MPNEIPPPANTPKTDSWRARAAGSWKWWLGFLAPLAVAGLAFGITAIVQATEMRADIKANAKDAGRNEASINKVSEDVKATRTVVGEMKLDLAVIREMVKTIKKAVETPLPRRRR